MRLVIALAFALTGSALADWEKKWQYDAPEGWGASPSTKAVAEDGSIAFVIVKLGEQINLVWLDPDGQPVHRAAAGGNPKILSLSKNLLVTATTKLPTGFTLTSYERTNESVVERSRDIEGALANFDFQANPNRSGAIFSFDGESGKWVQCHTYSSEANDPGVDEPSPIAIASGTSSGNILLNWATRTGTVYQIQKSTDLKKWSNIGRELTGTGADMTWSSAIADSEEWYRVAQVTKAR